MPTLTLLGRVDLRNDACLGQNPVPARTVKSLNPYPSESSMDTWIPYNTLFLTLLPPAPTIITCAPNQTSVVVRSGLYPWHTLSIVSLLPIPSFPRVPEGSLALSPSMMPVLAHLSVMLALSVLNANDAADLVRSFWARFTEKDVATLVRGALDLLRPLEPQAVITEEALGAHLAPMIGFLVGLYRYAYVRASLTATIKRICHSVTGLPRTLKYSGAHERCLLYANCLPAFVRSTKR
jgi:hypothetical protein